MEQALERLLNDARKGKLKGLVFTAKYSVWHHGVWVVGEYVNNPQDALEAVDRVRAGLIAHNVSINLPQVEPSVKSVGMLYQLIAEPNGRQYMPFCTDAIRRIFRMSPEDVAESALHIGSVIHPEDLPGLIKSVTEQNKTGGFWQREYRTLFPDGTGSNLIAKAEVEILPDGNVRWNGVIVERD